MTPLTIVAEPPPLSVDEHGSIRVAGTRVFLEMVVRAHQRGMSAEEIAEWFDVLDLADVYGALRYYLRNREAVEAYMARRDAEADALKAKILVTQKPFPTREELLARKAAREKGGA